MRGKTLNETKNILHGKKSLILRQSLIVRRLGCPAGVLPGKFWDLDLLKSPETCIFLFIHVCIFKIFKEGNQGT